MKNLIAWIEIPTENFDRAIDFYNAVFDFNLEKMDFGNEKMACLPGDVGAIFYKENYKPSKDGVIVSLNVEDIEHSLEKIQKQGGKIITQKTKIEVENRGYFALFVDCEGNRIGLYEDLK